MVFKKLKGANLYSFAISIILVSVGVVFIYLLPPYIINTLGNSTVFAAGDIATANARLGQVQGVGFAVIILGLIFMLVSVVGGLKGGD